MIGIRSRETRFARFFGIICVIATLCNATVSADEPYAEFLRALRERGYFDTALDYINRVSAQRGVPSEFAKSLNLERGITYRQQANRVRSAAEGQALLDKAERAIKKFVADYPDHPRAAYANSELGQLAFDRSNKLLGQAKAASGQEKAKLTAEARSIIDNASKIYQKSLRQYQAAYDKFPKTPIDQEEQPDLYLARRTAELSFLKADFNVARCAFERGLTFEEGTTERKKALDAAFKSFERIAMRNREAAIGVQAKLLMGRCFQEQGELGRALGLYNEVGDVLAQNPTAITLKSTALQFRLICLNDPRQADHQLVLEEAGRWLSNKTFRPLWTTPVGMGILWEKARAAEALSSDRTADSDTQNTLRRLAVADARKIAKYESAYKGTAIEMERRLMAAMGESDKDPTDFNTAFERGRQLVKEFNSLQKKRSSAKNEAERKKAEQALEFNLQETDRLLNLALKLQDEDSDPLAIVQTKYLLSFVYLQQRKNFDAWVLANYCMTRGRKIDPVSAEDATPVAINAALQCVTDAGTDNRFELNLLAETCQRIISDFPNSTRGNEARNRLGSVYSDLGQHMKAAENYLEVPQEYAAYPNARINAGLSYFREWGSAFNASVNGLSPEEDGDAIKKLRDQSRKLLTEGLNLARKDIGNDQEPTILMASGESVLALLNNRDGQYGEAIKRLQAFGKGSVAKAIQVPNSAKRPAEGIKSAAFAAEIYQRLLRAYVGEQKIDAALGIMTQLESIGGQNLSAIYTDLGRQLKNELSELKAGGDQQRYTDVQKSFEEFLEKVYARRSKTDYNSLTWIGSTYFDLGDGDRAAENAEGYFKKANQAFQEILDNNLVEAERRPGVELQQTRCLRALGNYETAYALFRKLLEQNPLLLDVQIEAAQGLSEWSQAGGGDLAKLNEAFGGYPETDQGDVKKSSVIWGWKSIIRRLAAREGQADWQDRRPQYLEARYDATNARYQYAKAAGNDPQQLKSARTELVSFAIAYTDFTDTEHAKFQGLYHQILQALGEPLSALPRPEKLQFNDPPPVEKVEEPAKDPEPETAPVATEPLSNPNWLLATLALGLAAGAGFGFYKVMSKPAARKRTSTASGPAPKIPDVGFAPPVGSDDVPDFSGLAAVSAPAVGTIAPPVRKKKSVKPAADSTSAAAGPVKKKAVRKKTASGDAPVARKKKRMVTPEEAARIKAARAAKAKAIAEGKLPPDGAVKKKKVLRKKVVKKKPPTPPEAPG